MQHCVDAGLIRQDRFLGSFPHPSTNAGDQVLFFLGETAGASITPGNPLPSRADSLDQSYARMSIAVLDLAQARTARGPAAGLLRTLIHAFYDQGWKPSELVRVGG